MKKNLPTIFGAILLIGGLGTFSKSIPGGLLIIIAGLLLLPASKVLLVQQFPRA